MVLNMKYLVLISLFCMAMSQDLPTNYQYYADGGIQSGLETINGAFLLNKKGFRLLSGAVHYFRVHPQYWRDRLKKVRAAGLNTVETYVPWNLHERHKDVFDFGAGTTEMSSLLDIVSYVKMAQEEDLFVIVRPGPYICSEWDFGGLPSWLLRDPDMRLRTSYPGYTDRVGNFYNQLIPLLTDLQFTKGGPIIGWQVENEYGHYQDDVDPAYMIYLRDKMLELGVVEQLFTSDTPTQRGDSGSVEGALQTANFKSGAAAEFAKLEELQPGMPKVAMEFWTGWFDHWGEPWHNTHDPEKMAEELSVILNDWTGNVNFYMFHGGTNFGFMNGANNLPVFPFYLADVSSYDYDALLTEAGDYTPKYYRAREMVLQHIPPVFTPEPPAENSKAVYRPVVFTEYIDMENLIRNLPTSHQFTDQTLPLAMEDLPINGDSGQNFGYILYRKNGASFGAGSTLTISGHVRDLAVLSVDGQLKSEAWTSDLQLADFGFWSVSNASYNFTDVTDGSHTLDILVENMGRNNFGVLKDFDQKKGIVEGPVLLDDEEVTGWDVYSFEFNGDWVQSLTQYQPVSGEIVGPALLSGSMYISLSETILDTYIDMSSWTESRGIVFVNGFNLGRYSTVGPCKSLYIPGPLLKYGENKFHVFELYHPQQSLVFSDTPNYGPTLGPGSEAPVGILQFES